MNVADWRAVCTSQGHRFGNSELIDVPEGNVSFLEVLLREARRVLKRSPNLWIEPPRGALPLTRADVSRCLGRLRRIEIPSAIVSAVSGDPDQSAASVAAISREWPTLPESLRLELEANEALRAYLDSLARPPLTGQRDAERRELDRVIVALRRADSGQWFPMPSFTFAQVSVWRVFCQLLARTIGPLDVVFHYPQYWSVDERMAALLIASTLANAMPTTQEQGMIVDMINRWSTELDFEKAANPAHYFLIRQFKFCRAEATGDRQFALKARDFIAVHSETWDRVLNRSYYDEHASDVPLLESTRAKQDTPKRRDLHTHVINTLLLERLHRWIPDWDAALREPRKVPAPHRPRAVEQTDVPRVLSRGRWDVHSHSHTYTTPSDSFRRAVGTIQRKGSASPDFGEILWRNLARRQIWLPAGSKLFRARLGCQAPVAGVVQPWSDDDIDAPPPEAARAGRCNRAGVSMLYCAEEENIAIFETAESTTNVISVCSPAVLRDVLVLDLIQRPAEETLSSSVSKYERLYDRDVQKLLDAFGEELARPVPRRRAGYVAITETDASEEYAVTQRLCDVVQRAGFDGIRYPSTRNASGSNVVLFNKTVARIGASWICTCPDEGLLGL